MDFEFLRGSGRRVLKFRKFRRGGGGGGGGHHKPCGTEIPREWGVNIKKPSVGGMDIFWNCKMMSVIKKTTILIPK